VRPGFTGLLALPGLVLVYINLAWLTLSLGIICTRYRDVQQIVNTGIQIMLFATPILWPISALGSAVIIAYINPLYHIMELVRAPMLGNVPSMLSWLVVTACAIGGWTVAMLLLRRASRRLVFWL
jgi:ABC-type polysaccharide/polyol phosphate export permease